MKKTAYDFSKAAEHANNWEKPSELSLGLKNAALALASLRDDDAELVKKMQRAVLDACWFLDAIKEKEVEL